MEIEEYGLDMHCNMILEQYRENLPVYEKIKDVATEAIKKCIQDNGIYVNAIESRVKTEKSLAGKLELKGHKYGDISDLTDIVGVRVITFYTDEVDKIAAMADKIFDVDWDNCVDKRKMHELNSFGYNSLHYICRIPKSLYSDPEHPEINELRLELQMRTALQHVWSTIHHDTGYKSDVEVPVEYLRNISRLAGMLELADEQFSLIRTNINDYRRKVQSLVADGKFEEVPLNGDTFRSYLQLHPFDKLTKRIAAINQAEVHETSTIPYLKSLSLIGLKSLGDVQKLIKDNSEDAYELAVYELGNTDIDIISSTIAIQNLLAVKILKEGGGVRELVMLMDAAIGPSPYSERRAETIIQHAKNLKFMNHNG